MPIKHNGPSTPTDNQVERKANAERERKEKEQEADSIGALNKDAKGFKDPNDLDHVAKDGESNVHTDPIENEPVNPVNPPQENEK